MRTAAVEMPASSAAAVSLGESLEALEFSTGALVLYIPKPYSNYKGPYVILSVLCMSL